MNISTLVSELHDGSGEQNINIHWLVAHALFYVIKNYFLTRASYYSHTLSCRRYYTCHFYNDLMVKLFQLWDIQILQLIVVHANSTVRVPGDRKYNMILTDSYKAFLETDIISYTQDYSNNEYYFIVLQAQEHLLLDEMQLIFDYCWLNYLINCVIQIQTAKGGVQLYTYFPFTAKHCYKIQPVLFNQFNGTMFTHPELFPRKLKNLYGCKLKAALWNIAPYLRLQTDENENSRIIGGFEGTMLKTISEKLNFSIEILSPPNSEQRGVIVNGTLNGAMGMLEKHTADISLGCFRQTFERSRYASPTMVYHQEQIIAVLYKPAFAFNSLELLVHPFTSNAWLMCFIVVILAFLMRYFENTILLSSAAEVEDKPQNFLSVVETVLGIPNVRLPKNSIRRFLLLLWFWLMFIIRNSYQALLFHLIRTQQTKPIPNSIDTLLSENYTYVMSKDILNDINFAKNFVSIVVPYGQNPLKQLEDTKRGSRVCVTTTTFFRNNIHKNRKAGDYFPIPEQIVISYITMYLSKHSFLLDEFNNQLSWIISTGLTKAWLSWEVDFNYFSKGHTMQNQLFGMKELWAAFLIVIFGCLFSCFIFVLELISIKYKYMQKMFNNFN